MSTLRTGLRQLFAVKVLLATLWACAASVSAHEIAADVKIQAYVKPEGQRLRVIVRAPLQAMRDIEFPMQGPYLAIDRAQPSLRNAAVTWIANSMEVRAAGTTLPAPEVAAVQASIASDRSFASYADALAHVTGPALGTGSNVPLEQAYLDVLLEYRLPEANPELSLRTHLERLGQRVVTVLWFLPPEGTIRAFEYLGDPGLIRLDPRWHQAALRFIELGFRHILDGMDHLLFLFCLVIPFRRLRPLLVIVTSFTVAHSITLIASAFNFAPTALWFPPLIETLIASSIVYMALENIAGAASQRPLGLERRWIITFGFGLVHGFGFSFALHETLQFAGSHLVTSLLAFNLGVELGQLLVLALLMPALWLLFRWGTGERIVTVLLSALVAHTGWHWMLERWEALRQFPAQALWPALLTAGLFILAAVALAWTSKVLRQRKRSLSAQAVAGPPDAEKTRF